MCVILELLTQNMEKETKEVTMVIPKMEVETIKFTQTFGEDEKVLEEIKKNYKGANLLFTYFP